MTFELGTVNLSDMLTLGAVLITAGGLLWQVRANATALESLRAEVKRDHEALGVKVDETHGRIDTLFSKDAERREAIAATGSDVTNLRDRMGRAEKHIDKMGQRVGIGSVVS